MTGADNGSTGGTRLARDEVADACRRILGHTPDEIDESGDSQRKSVGAVVNGRRVIVTCRDSDARAALEAHVLETLHGRGAPVPALIGIDGRWLVQEHLGDLRLSRTLRGVTRREGARLLDAALSSLADIQEKGREAGLQRELYRIGAREDWLDGLMETPQRIGAFLGLPAPALETEPLRQRLTPGEPAFIKWDARPPNAMPRPDGTVAWFDWEHCGCRDPLDDLVWFFGDESIPEAPDIETRLLARHVLRFRAGRSEDDAGLYIRAFGALHVAVRLSITVADFARDRDPDWRETLSGGRIGDLPGPALRLCRRGARWAADVPEARPLAAWYRDIEARFGGEYGETT